MCDEAIAYNGGTLKFVQIVFKKRFVTKLLINMLIHQNSFVVAIRLKKCVINLLIIMVLL